jgi:hypothetical protein
MNPNVDTLMAHTMRRNLVRYAVQQTIACGHCGEIADMRRYVIVFTLPGDTVAWQGCSTCWGKAPIAGYQDIKLRGGGRLEVLDGRLLWAPAPRPYKRRNARGMRRVA